MQEYSWVSFQKQPISWRLNGWNLILLTDIVISSLEEMFPDLSIVVASEKVPFQGMGLKIMLQILFDCYSRMNFFLRILNVNNLLHLKRSGDSNIKIVQSKCC